MGIGKGSGRGGARANSGPDIGTQQAHTLAKRGNREIIRKLVEAQLAQIVNAQVLNAQGVSYMVLRAPDGSFARATDEKQIDAACAVGESAFRIFTQQPNQSSASMLLGYVADKPVEPVEHSGPEGGPIDIVERLRERLVKYRPSGS